MNNFHKRSLYQFGAGFFCGYQREHPGIKCNIMLLSAK